MPCGDLTDGRPGFERFADDADLLLSTPLAATLSTRDNLDHPLRHDGSNHTLKLALRCHPWSKPAVRNRRPRPDAYRYIAHGYRAVRGPTTALSSWNNPRVESD